MAVKRVAIRRWAWVSLRFPERVEAPAVGGVPYELALNACVFAALALSLCMPSAERLQRRIEGTSNQIHGLTDDPRIQLDVRGDGNRIVLPADLTFASARSVLRIVMHGNHHVIELGPNTINKTLELHIAPAAFMSGGPAHGSSIVIDSGNVFNGMVRMTAGERETAIRIGRGNLFARSTLQTTDSHCVYALADGGRLNPPASIAIGNHCWIGDDVGISKGVRLADHTIVAQRALVTKSFERTHTLIGGVPARVLRTDVGWHIDVDRQSLGGLADD